MPRCCREVIEARIGTYPEGAVGSFFHFNHNSADDLQLEFSLLALRDDPIPQLEAELTHLQASNDQSAAAELVVKIANEKNKRERWAVSHFYIGAWPNPLCLTFTSLSRQFENSLRRHNHVGLVHALLLALAKAGKLQSAKEGATIALKERRERSRAKGQTSDED